MTDHRLEPVVRTICNYFGFCECEGMIDKCPIDKDIAVEILKASDQSDKEHGIVHVPEIPNHDMLMIGFKCAMQGESPGIIYKSMLKAFQK